MHNLISTEMEDRVISWVSGETSESETAELERLAASKPEIRVFKNRVAALHDLAQVAVAVDEEPLRLSEERRHELMATFNAVRRRNLAFSASFTVLLIAGIAWYGERTHAIPPIHLITITRPEDPFPLPPEPPTLVDDNRASKAQRPEVAAPELPDTLVAPRPNDITVPIEPIQPIVDNHLVKIPDGGGGGGVTFHPFNLSQLDEQPAIKYSSRPVYPESMRRLGLSGEAMIDFIVDPNGNVRNATAVHSSNREFEEAACAAVSRWSFRPGRKGGRAVFVHMQIPIVFTLNQD